MQRWQTSAALIALLLLAPSMFTSVSGTTPKDTTTDGAVGEWDASTLMGTSGAVSLHTTWNATHFQLAWLGTDWASESDGADLFIYFDTTEGGSNRSKDWGGQHILPIEADAAFMLEDSSYFRLQRWNGTAWEDGEQTGLASFIGHSENKNTEIAMPWQDLDAGENLTFLVWAQWQDGNKVWASFPTENPSSAHDTEIFTHVYHITNRSTPSNPANTSVLPEAPVVDSGNGTTPYKDPKALNVAIVFHQHQPYYKNKLTNMYEMPWVRVHAMTEYVDSPGILADYPDTKITYNLVPSFVEQLVDYHEERTLDIHTDWAQRSWSVDENGTLTGYPEMTDLELHTLQFQMFWNSGWVYNVTSNDPMLKWLAPASETYSDLYSRTRHNLKPATIMDDDLLSPQDLLDLVVLYHLFQFSPYYIQGEYATLEDPTTDGRPAHENASLQALFTQRGGYTPEDLELVLDLQHSHMANVLPMYSALAERGQVELTTTPYYHPIMPLLMKEGWTYEDGIRIDKQAWPEDVRNHLTTGMDLFEEELGFRPVGMWPSEQSVSPAMVTPVVQAGIEWMVTDELNLAESVMADGSYPDVNDPAVLATPWNVTADDGSKIAVVFRDRVISDRIAFQYGSMTPADAVSDFLGYLDGVRTELILDNKDPSEHLLTVALDGENWMFMSEFQHVDGARPFMHEWYSRLSSHPTIMTTTPGEFLEGNRTLPEITTIGEGSWIDGTLSTWAGEEEESLGWQRLIEARQALVDFSTENPDHTGLDAAWESLYIAEGSDWFWWYGLDQNSGYDENWDVLFKVHLSNIYRAVGLDLPPYLLDLWTAAASPSTPYGGVIEPMIDGIALPGEWDNAARYDASSITGANKLDIESFHLGFDASNVYVRVDLPDSVNGWQALDSSWSPDLSLYFMQPNAVNFNEVETNFLTYYGNQVLGFPAKTMVSFDFDQLRADGKAKYNLFEARGKSGDMEQWVLSSTSILGGCAADDVYEFRIPWSELGLAPRYSTRVKVVTSQAESLAYGDGTEAEMAPPAPAEMVMPDLEDWVTLLDIDDDTGDENGAGAYTYPLAADFDPGVGLWDITHLKVSQSAWNARFEVTMAEMTDFWSLSNGFSHQIIQIYVDKGDHMWGETDMLEGANAVIDPGWAWEVAISATGEPGAVKAVQAQTGETSAKGIEVHGDVATNVISITVSKSVIGDDVPSYRFVIVVGSQDGFGPGKWRDVDAVAKTWRLGGGADPNPDTGVDYDPNVLDIVLEGDGQASMLSAYDVEAQQPAVLTGIEIPEIEQQIYGAGIASTTATSAILEWSTTKEAVGHITCASVGQTTNENLTFTSSAGTSHALPMTGFLANSSYECTLSVEGADSITVQFTTSAIIDQTPPEVLNLAVEVITGGWSFRVTWYTDEATTELIEVGGQTFTGDLVALRKNHDMTITPYPELIALQAYMLKVTVVDASGNANSSSVEFTIAEEEAASPLPDEAFPNGEDPGGSEEGTSQREASSQELGDMLAQPVVQIVLMIGVLFVVLAFVRSRRGDGDDQW